VERTSPLGATAIDVSDLSKTFGDGELAVTAVQGINLTVDHGEVVIIMGPSGSGKTTLLLMLGAMLRPTTGRIVIGDVDLARAPERSLPRLRATHLGFIFQDFNLLSALSAAENVELACNLAGITGNPAHERARKLLERVGLHHRLHHRPDQLSGGEKQRVAVARALANDPPVLLADEPTANLDSSHGHDVALLLRHLATDDGRCVVIVSHDERLEDVADRVLWLEDGSFTQLADMAVDPVCGMNVRQHEPTVHYRHAGATWWFCSTRCRDEFAQEPRAFTGDRRSARAGAGEVSAARRPVRPSPTGSDS
jgi:putative ABC transport system ATP-binding protein